MTHYCAAGNQPRLKAASIDQEKKIIHFTYLDAAHRYEHILPDRKKALG